VDFSATLLREKFVIRDERDTRAAEGREPVIALSNRIVLSLYDESGKVWESFVIRAQVMYCCIRMAAKIAHSFVRLGPLMARDRKFDFMEAWDDITADHERLFNPGSWVAVYNGGKRIFSHNDYHAFLDIIENCEARNKSGTYESSVAIAEDIFAQQGRKVSIQHEATTGFVLDIRGGRARCALILRSPVRRNNFSFTVEMKAGADISVAQCLTVSAAYLEGINLSYLIGRANERLRLEEISRYSDEDKRAVSARKRMARLKAEIESLENAFTVRYRPERPEFGEIVLDAEKYTRKQWEYEQAEKEAAG
jgi:hypothetical protein